jgi:hypothetical protein
MYQPSYFFSAEASDIKVLINGKERKFPPSPVIKNGSTLVSMRGFFVEALGCDVTGMVPTRTAYWKSKGL